MKRSEAAEQVALIRWTEIFSHKVPELKMIFHIPNGGSRNRMEAANLKMQGVKAGVPDLMLAVPAGGMHGLFIEMKYGKNRTTKKQDEWIADLKKYGYETAVCYSAEQAAKKIMDYLDISEKVRW